MSGKRLTRFLDLAFVSAGFIVAQNVSSIPYPRNLQGLWQTHSHSLRVIGFGLWLLSLWVVQYRTWDQADKVNVSAVLLGAAEAACLIWAACMMEWNLYFHKVRLFQGLLGGAALITCAVCWLLSRVLERENPESREAAAQQRTTLAVAFGIIAVGVVLCIIRSQRSVVYAMIISALWMLGACFMRRGQH